MLRVFFIALNLEALPPPKKIISPTKTLIIHSNKSLLFQCHPICWNLSAARSVASLSYCYWRNGWQYHLCDWSVCEDIQHFTNNGTLVLTRIRRRKSPVFLSHFQPYLIVLALVDSFLILMYLIDNVIVGHVTMSDHQWFYTVIPYFTHPIKNISITMSMVWLVIIAIERFMAVTHPFNDQDSFYLYFLFLAIFSITVNFPK